MTAREAMDNLMTGLTNIEDFEEALEIINGVVNNDNGVGEGQDESNSMWEQRYMGLRQAYEKKWGEYTSDDNVRSVLSESVSSGFNRVDGYRPAKLTELDMSFDGSTE